jgi:hypothetical protein
MVVLKSIGKKWVIDFFLCCYLTKYAYFFIDKETKQKTIFTKNRGALFSPPIYLQQKTAKSLLETAFRFAFATQKRSSQS